VDARGSIAASASRPNEAVPQPGGEPAWRVWDLEAIWEKLCDASREVMAALDSTRVRGVLVTTWGADGAPCRPDGGLAYPVISWQCPRTEPQVTPVQQRMAPREIYSITGYPVIAFNTLLRWLWLREHAPAALEPPNRWLMVAGLLNHRLTGEATVDSTGASTTMAMDLGRRAWSERMLSLAGLDTSYFPRWVEPGERVGTVSPAAAEQCGIPARCPVFAGGHDTQFAVIGSGAAAGEAVVSSGTWEILIVPTDQFRPTDKGLETGLVIEADARPGLWDPQCLMMGSGVLEWVRATFYPELPAGAATYAAMIADAEAAGVGASGVTLIPSFVSGTGPTRRFDTQGTLLGLSLAAERGQIYRAALEGLAFQLRDGLRVLSEATGFEPRALRVVGGGARNELWNRLRADVTGLPVIVTGQQEATVAGAAIFGFAGSGVYRDVAEAQQAFESGRRVFEPSADGQRYEALYDRYTLAPPALQPFYHVE
jgi:L-fuculokinase